MCESTVHDSNGDSWHVLDIYCDGVRYLAASLNQQPYEVTRVFTGPQDALDLPLPGTGDAQASTPQEAKEVVQQFVQAADHFKRAAKKKGNRMVEWWE